MRELLQSFGDHVRLYQTGMECYGIDMRVLRRDIHRGLDDGKLANGVSRTAGRDVKTGYGVKLMIIAGFSSVVGSIW